MQRLFRCRYLLSAVIVFQKTIKAFQRAFIVYTLPILRIPLIKTIGLIIFQDN